jgi:excisionase family DNA binding protein
MAGASISRLRSKPETARILGISLATLDRRIADGSIEYYKQGWRVMFGDAQIEAYLERCRNAPRHRHSARGKKAAGRRAQKAA